jgi:hypothetical protein
MLKVTHHPGCTNAVEGKFVGLLIWGKYIARFLDGKVWEVRNTPPRKDITHGSKVTLIEAKTKLKDSNPSKNLRRICFTATFDGYKACSTGDFWCSLFEASCHFRRARYVPSARNNVVFLEIQGCCIGAAS